MGYVGKQISNHALIAFVEPRERPERRRRGVERSEHCTPVPKNKTGAVRRDRTCLILLVEQVRSPEHEHRRAGPLGPGTRHVLGVSELERRPRRARIQTLNREPRAPAGGVGGWRHSPARTIRSPRDASRAERRSRGVERARIAPRPQKKQDQSGRQDSNLRSPRPERGAWPG